MFSLMDSARDTLEGGSKPTSGGIFSAAYALWLYRRVVFGDLIKESLKSITDMTAREKWIFAPLVVMTILLGVYPSLVTDITGPSVARLVDQVEVAVAAHDTDSAIASAAVAICTPASS